MIRKGILLLLPGEALTFEKTYESDVGMELSELREIIVGLFEQYGFDTVALSREVGDEISSVIIESILDKMEVRK